MNSVRGKVAGLSSLFLCALSAWGANQNLIQAAVAPESTKLHLEAGTFDTRVLTNALIAQPAQYEFGKAYVLQMDGPMTPARHAALVAAGVDLQTYLPDHAFIVELGQTLPASLERLPFVQWVGEYQNGWKLSPTIGQRLVPFESPERIQIANEGRFKLVVILFVGRDLEQGKADLQALGAEIVAGDMIGDQAAIDLIMDAQSLGVLAEQPYVQFVEEAPELTLRNSTNRWIVQSNVTNVTPLYANGIKGLGQIVGIMDGRVNVNHCSFFDTDPIGPLHRKIAAYNTSTGVDSHGTHVAGTAVGDNFVDDNTRGVAYEGRLVYSLIPSFNETSMVNALNLQHSQGARVFTNSWGNDGTTSYDSLCRGIDVFSRNNEDDLILFAVTNLSTLKNPENAKNLLAVGASRDTPQQHLHCSGGSGPTIDQRRKPEIYAPGCSTTSSSGSCSTANMTGTSMASPAVAGTALLVRQYFMDGFYPSGALNPSDAFTPTGALVKATLLNASVDMTGISGYPSNQEGWGRVLADEALYFSGDARKLIVKDIRNADGFSTGGTTSHAVNVTGSVEKLKITMVFTDVAASAGAAQAAINDLDLQVESPTGVLYLGNVFSGGVSVIGGLKDAKNNVEQVHLNAPEIGTWTVRVNGFAVNQSTQGYALAISGEVTLDPTCSDGILNQGEDLIDCGGPCPACLCLVDEDCDDNAYCNGVETCTDIGRCFNGTNPCGMLNPPACDEVNDVCVDCVIDADCDDGLFCTGTETCDALNTCHAGSDPCVGTGSPFCNDVTDLCDECLGDADCNDANSCTNDVCGLGAPNLCGHTQLTILYADVNDSGVLDVDDLSCVLGGFISPPTCPNGDVEPCTGDGDIDVDDILAFLETFMGAAPCSDPCPEQP